MTHKKLKSILFKKKIFLDFFAVYYTAVPLTLHRHTGIDPVSCKSLKPLDSGLRRNDGGFFSIFFGLLLICRRIVVVYYHPSDFEA